MKRSATRTGEFKDFVASLTDGKYLLVRHYQHDTNPGEGSHEARRMTYYFKIIWGVMSDYQQDVHSGGSVSAVVHPVTVDEIRDIIKFCSGRFERLIVDAAVEWAQNLENDEPAWAETSAGNIILIYQMEGSEDRQRILTSDELLSFWQWAVGLGMFDDFPV